MTEYAANMNKTVKENNAELSKIDPHMRKE